MAANLKIKKLQYPTMMYTVSPFNFLNNCQKLTNFNDFWYVKSGDNLKRKSYRFVHLTCQMYPLYLGKSTKVIVFSTVLFIHASDYLH